MNKSITQYTTHRLVRSEHLNHHGTLFAGYGAQWFVESGFVAASKMLPAKNLICVEIDTLSFKRPVNSGEVICFNSRIIYAGKTSIVAYTKISSDDCSNNIVDGYAVFVHVDENTKPFQHNIELEVSCDEDKLLIEKYKLKKNK
jgi:acyl-CoA hydrolase